MRADHRRRRVGLADPPLAVRMLEVIPGAMLPSSTTRTLCWAIGDLLGRAGVNL